MQVLLARRGIWESWFATQYRKKATVAHTIFYMPEIVINFSFTYLFVILIFTLLGCVLFWSKLRDSLLKFILTMVGSLVFVLINMVMFTLMLVKACDKDRLMNRRIFLMFDFYMNMFGIIGSLVSALMRLIMGIVMLI